MKRASKEKNEFFELIDNLVTAKSDHISINGNVILEKDKKYKIEDVEYTESFYGKGSGQYYPPKINFIKLKDVEGLFTKDSFYEKDSI